MGCGYAKEIFNHSAKFMTPSFLKGKGIFIYPNNAIHCFKLWEFENLFERQRDRVPTHWFIIMPAMTEIARNAMLVCHRDDRT